MLPRQRYGAVEHPSSPWNVSAPGTRHTCHAKRIRFANAVTGLAQLSRGETRGRLRHHQVIATEMHLSAPHARHRGKRWHPRVARILDCPLLALIRAVELP